MKNGRHSNGHHPEDHHPIDGVQDVRMNLPDRTEETMYGVSQIGIHDLVPQLGYREYWYPAIEVRKIGRKPKRVKMLGDDIVVFRGKDGKVGALKDRCPHRGAFLSYGRCEFQGTISCPYHGYTFDETGKCVAAITEGPDSPMVGKLKARAYPTAVLRGIAYVWMGQTDPVPLEEDLPSEFFDSKYAVHVYSKVWPMNWAVSIEQNEDAHFSWIHRFRMRRLFTMEAFRQIPAYWSGMSVVGETDSTMGIKPTVKAPQQAYYPGLGKKWPQHVWWRFRSQRQPGSKTLSKKNFSHEYRLPCVARVHQTGPGSLHQRYVTPLDEDSCWQFSMGTARVNNWVQRIYWTIYMAIWYRIMTVDLANGFEDVSCQRSDRLDPYAPQKLGANDAPVIIWRRRMPFSSRDNQRIWKMGMNITEDIQQEVKEYEEAAEAAVQSADD
jgi:phenylpropionate dioxygenase-like ring-hydroxylating dioxygenase large terminal subunit